jgi:acetyl esterase
MDVVEKCAEDAVISEPTGGVPSTNDSPIPLPPELLEFQRTLAPPATGGSIPELLASFDDYTNQQMPVVGNVSTGVPIRDIAGWRVTADVYTPVGEPPFPVLVYLHGGGWVMGAPSTHRRLAADLATLGLLTVVVDYRRAPKHRFPAAVEDTIDAINWVRDHASDLGGDSSRLLVGGDSAGANLAAAALATGEAGDVAAALLCYGIFDVQRALPSLVELIGGPDPHAQLYLEPDDVLGLTDDPRLHPERYCSEFPATLVLVGEHDPLLAESQALADRLADTPVAFEFVVAPDAPHGFLQLPTHPSHDIGLRAIDDFLHQAGVLGHTREAHSP